MELLGVALRLEALANEIRLSITQPPPPPPVNVPPIKLVPPVNQPPINFTKYKDDYEQKWLSCSINDSRRGEVKSIVDKIQQNAARYQNVATKINLPIWQLIGIVHNLESNMDFTTHLHNGDPLTSRTKHIPIGRPHTGYPPFTWEESAIDALDTDQGWNVWNDWSIVGMGYMLERYNGFGYRNHGVPSPYLWAGTNIYTKGRYVADGHFDPNSVSKQIGGMTVLKYLYT